jgi:predicted nucleic acid-binding protein
MATLPFLDTNILLRHLRADIPDQSPRATALIERIERGEIEVATADVVVFETVFTLQRSYKVPKDRIRDAVLPILELPSLGLPGKRRYREVFDLYVTHNIAFGDACLAVQMRQSVSTQVFSFDREFDRVPGIERMEPE